LAGYFRLCQRLLWIRQADICEYVAASLLNLYPSGHVRLLLFLDHGSEMPFGFGEPPANQLQVPLWRLDSGFGFFLKAVEHIDEASGCPAPGMAIGPSVSSLAKPLGAPSRLRLFQLYSAGSRRELVCSFCSFGHYSKLRLDTPRRDTG
jgi:hypothetical protein